MQKEPALIIMTDLKAGQIVQNDSGFYIVRNGANPGEFIITPIMVDPSREPVKVTDEVKSTLIKTYGN